MVMNPRKFTAGKRLAKPLLLGTLFAGLATGFVYRYNVNFCYCVKVCTGCVPCLRSHCPTRTISRGKASAFKSFVY